MATKSPFVSHTMMQVAIALVTGPGAYYLTTGDAGEDDVLLGSYEECLQDVLVYIERDTLPADWLLTKIEAIVIPTGEIIT